MNGFNIATVTEAAKVREALGAALLLDATIAGTVDVPLLRAGAHDLAVDYRFIG